KNPRTFVLGLTVVLSMALVGCASASSIGQAPPPPLELEEPTLSVEPIERDVFDRTLYSLRDPNSVWVIVNKQLPFDPKNFVPDDLVPTTGVPNRPGEPLREVAAAALKQLYDAAY